MTAAAPSNGTVPHMDSNDDLKILLSPARAVLRFQYAGTDLVVVGKDSLALARIARALRVGRTRRVHAGVWAVTAVPAEQMPRPHMPVKGARRR